MTSRTETPDRSASDHVDVALTPATRYGREYDDFARTILNEPEYEYARKAVAAITEGKSTPLVRLAEIATRCGVAEVTIKLEGERRPIGSFKLLGPPFALAVHLAQRLSGSRFPDAELVIRVIRGNCADAVDRFTAVAATSGNHGRALAWGARQFGCRCLIFMPDATGAAREQSIRGWGADTRRVPGVYDDAVNAATDYAAKHDAILVGDGATDDSGIRRHILHGYAVLGDEWRTSFSAERESHPIEHSLKRSPPPTHLFLPAGSGTLAAGITARWWMSCGVNRPKIVIVQPNSCNSAIRSSRADRCESTLGDTKTFMDGLSVGTISNDAWRILRSGAFGHLTIDETLGLRAFHEIAETTALKIGETGIAAFAGMLAATENPGIRQMLEIDSNSRISLIATEGITDSAVYAEVLRRARRDTGRLTRERTTSPRLDQDIPGITPHDVRFP